MVVLTNHNAFIYSVLGMSLLLQLGCGGREPPVEMGTVKGVVKYADGSIPQGEIVRIVFNPVFDQDVRYQKMASGHVQPDGTYQLGTVEPGDGVMPGRYRVLLEIREKHDDPDMLISGDYLHPERTPLPEVTVKEGVNEFNFTDIPRP